MASRVIARIGDTVVTLEHDGGFAQRVTVSGGGKRGVHVAVVGPTRSKHEATLQSGRELALPRSSGRIAYVAREDGRLPFEIRIGER
jgi:hypothetical protein